MFVRKRSGEKVHVSFDEISNRIRQLCHDRGLATVETDGDDGQINVELLAKKTISNLPHERDRIISTSEIDLLSAEIAESMSLERYAYHKLAGYLLVSNLQKETPTTFSEAVKQLVATDSSYLSSGFVEFVLEHAHFLDHLIDHNKDYKYDYFAVQTLRKGYLLRNLAGKTMERPQYMHLRVAVALCLQDGDLSAIAQNYRLFSDLAYTHASPTLFNAGKPLGNFGSCFLLEISHDSLESIYETITDCAFISKAAGGIGVAISRVRGKGAIIKSSRGKADGLIPMLKVIDATAVYINQSGSRKGAISVYLEPWHVDVFDFLELKTNEGDENNKTRNLFQGLWVPDLFMQRVEAEENWSLFSPDDTPDLVDLWGVDFETKYLEYETSGKAKKIVAAQTLWWAILKCQIETGGPYMLYKDACNRNSNQLNIGTIKSSNLCTEIMEVANETEIANCNLSSISLPYFVVRGDGDDGMMDFDFDFKLLRVVCAIAVENLNRVIDTTKYPTDKCCKSNLRHRPLGIGVQGLADVYMMLGLPYESDEACVLNKKIFEHMYFGCLNASIDLAARHGPYETYEGSPASKGILQPDMWGLSESDYSAELDWSGLRRRLAKHGLRNSLLIALMPTASTSSIFGNIESFEPQTTNLYVRRTQTGEFCLLNKHLVRELEVRNLWQPEVIEQLQRDKGSVQNIASIPEDVRDVFKTCWEMKPPKLVEQSADRGPWICQSQSFNAFISVPSYERLTAYHFYCWNKGLKTGMYYLRTRPAFDAVDISVKPAAAPATSASCRRDDKSCISCSS